MYSGYVKIADSSSNWLASKKESKLIKTTRWCVLEKVHGSCFCFVYDVVASTIDVAKRKEILKEDDGFFGYSAIMEETLPKIKNVVQYVDANYAENKTKICIYGELFGGIYPHKDVIANTDVHPVQSGIYYSPNLHFYAFDISILNEKFEKYLDYEFSLKAFKTNNLLHAAPLFIGSFEESTNYKIGFNTTIPSFFKLPLIEGNKAEGIVVKPMKEINVTTANGQLVRAIVKIKIPEFSEKKFGEVKKPVLITNIDFDYYTYFVEHELDNLMTINRVNNAISKIGERDKNRLIELVLEDVIYEVENNELWKELMVDQQHNVLSEARKQVEILIKEIKN